MTGVQTCALPILVHVGIPPIHGTRLTSEGLVERTLWFNEEYRRVDPGQVFHEFLAQSFAWIVIKESERTVTDSTRDVLFGVFAELAVNQPERYRLWNRTDCGNSYPKCKDEWVKRLGERCQNLGCKDARTHWRDFVRAWVPQRPVGSKIPYDFLFDNCYSRKPLALRKLLNEFYNKL